MMSRKDYRLIADAIAEQAALYHSGPTENSLAKAAIKATVERRGLFIEACGFPLPLRS